MKDDEKMVVEEDTVVEQNGLEGSACWTAEESHKIYSLVWEEKGL